MSLEARAGGGEARALKSREVRLGLVMYGGVSLAIYINGVAQELFRAVRGRGTYRLLKALTDSDVVVDVLSGSSAGGVNGILLAYALCNECEFRSAAGLWRQRGDIGGLLRDVDAPLESYQSLLDSENKYEPWLREAFDAMGHDPIRKVSEDPSRTRELDLFVTGTDFYGRKWATADDRDSVLEVQDHRTVFWLKHREGRKEPFFPLAGSADERRDGGPRTTHAALARLSRITSCFPGAFAPVTVGLDDAVDARLRRWANLTPAAGARVFIDGGVLDNKPFTTTLDAIYSRLADRPVSRWLLYVEPDPERFGSDPAVPESPSIVQTALASLTRLPAYESIAGDLKSLARHNADARRVHRIRRDLLLDARKPLANAEGTPDIAGEEEHRRYRLLGLVERLFASFFGPELEGGDVARHARSSRAMSGDAARRTFEAESLLREWFDAHVVREAGPRSQALLHLDPLFRLRRLLYLTYEIDDELYARQDVGGAVNRQIELLEIVRAALETALDQVGTRVFAEVAKSEALVLDDAWAERAWELALTVLLRIDRVPFPGGDADLQAFARVLAAAAADPAPVGPLGSFFDASDAYERRALASYPEIVPVYDDFMRVDRVLFKVEYLSGLRSHDVIRVARVSPVDAQLGLAGIDGKRKVTGLRFGHFAAFFKRSWRSNDILWGRIDGACELVDVLLDTERVRSLFGRDAPVQPVLERLRHVVDELELEAGALPLPPPDRAALFAWLRELASDDGALRKQALGELERSKSEPCAPGPFEWLVHGCQLEVLPEGLRDVLYDARAEELERESVTGGVLNGAAAATFADRALERLAASPEGVAGFFRDGYRVGEEDLRSIPALVLVDRLTRAIVVARNGLLASLGDYAVVVRAHPLYQIFLGFPPRILAAVFSMIGGGSRGLRLFTFGAVAYIALSLLLLVLFGAPILRGEHPTLGRALFIGLPLGLALVLWFVSRVRGASGKLAGLLRVVWAALFVVFLAACVPVVMVTLSGATTEWCQKARTPQAPTPEALICTLWREPFASIAPLAVVVCALFGLLWFVGVFGWLEYKLRLRSKAALSVRSPDGA